MRVAVIGGAGGMGRVAVTDLAHSAGVDEVLIVDTDHGRARALAAGLRSARVVPAGTALAPALAGVDGVVNAAGHRLNVQVMEACLEVGAHYTDLGGLYHWALAQYELADRFAAAGLAAAISMGSAPGVTNMLAAACCARLDTVDGIELADAIIPSCPADPAEPYVPPYAPSTLVDEFTAPAAVFEGGATRMVPAGSGGKTYAFPEGDVECVYTIHSEPATLPRSYAVKGIRRVEWRLGLPPLEVARLRAFVAAGLASDEPVAAGGAEVVPREVLVAVLARQARTLTPPEDAGLVEWLRAVVTGERSGAPAELVAELCARERPEWPAGAGATLTGTPPSIAIQLLCRGERLGDGVGGPEAMLPVEPFFTELARRGLEGTLRDGDRIEPLAPA